MLLRLRWKRSNLRQGLKWRRSFLYLMRSSQLQRFRLHIPSRMSRKTKAGNSASQRDREQKQCQLRAILRKVCKGRWLTMRTARPIPRTGAPNMVSTTWTFSKKRRHHRSRVEEQQQLGRCPASHLRFSSSAERQDLMALLIEVADACEPSG